MEEVTCELGMSQLCKELGGAREEHSRRGKKKVERLVLFKNTTETSM